MPNTYPINAEATDYTLYYAQSILCSEIRCVATAISAHKVVHFFVCMNRCHW